MKVCKQCTTAVYDDDPLSCQKCKKVSHFTCTRLSDYEIKLYKKNPYKPWRCATCVDKYCFHCNKTTDNLDSICCDKCSFWFHQDCSNLEMHEFELFCNTPEKSWTCPPCKQKLCVRCNISTHNKSKTSCCLCKNLYHNVCAGLKSKNHVSDWLCGICRPSVFPFHNVDYKTLIKLSTSCDKYSLQNLTLLATEMSRKCSVCTKVLSKSNPGIPCFCCNSKVHVKCSKLIDPKNTFHSFKGNWQCENCMKDKFPFCEIDNDSLAHIFENSLPKKEKFSPEFSIDDKLKLLLSYSSKSNWYAHVCDNETDPHDNFTHNYESKPNFHYYDVTDFRKTQQTWDRHGTLSLFHTNISSLQGNFIKMDDLLVDLAWNFDVIALSETWNDVKNETNFTPPLLEGYHPYSGTTGSSLKGGCGLYIKDTLSPSPRKDLEFKIEDRDAQSECRWLELISDTGPNTIIGVFYRHPSGKADKFLAQLQTTLKRVNKEKKKTVICGDFNFNLLNFDLDKHVNNFLCTMLDHSFHPCITEPTRITNSNKPSLVDNIFTNTFDNPVSGNILEQISYDHLPNFVITDHVKKKKLENQFKRDKRNFNADKFQADLLGDNLLGNLLNAKDTDIAFDTFRTKYCNLMDKHAPLKKLTKK